ncbi:MAG: DUF1287 domain-containing protein [Tissierellia bacterium]|nr:DUF1287 domain-containing protein [Tissierellia bacterium]
MKKFILLASILICLTACEKDTNSNLSKNDPIIIDARSLEETKEIEEEKFPALKSEIDFNDNGIDDYRDFVIGARKDAMNHPKYKSDYISENNGYPPSDEGVCTDVIWRAFKEAGYSLREMLNQDIRKRRDAYTNIEDKPDRNIDFRRVKTLKPFFKEYAEELEIELNDPNNWQPGDIIFFNPRDYHIGILSDNRNEEGFPLVFHNEGQQEREEDILFKKEISGHFRFNAKNIPEDVLKAWTPGEDGEN